MKTLNELFKKYGSDKGDGGHNYGPVYERIFQRRNVNALLEVGVEKGYSLRAWAEYFPDAFIFGLDKEHPKGWEPHMRIAPIYADQNSLESFFHNFIQRLPPLDVIVDDGGHCMNHHIITLAGLWHKLRPGGVYVVEDCLTCNWPTTNTLYDQPVRNENENTLETFLRFKRTGTLFSSFVAAHHLTSIEPWIERVSIIGDDNEETTDIKGIKEHGLIIIEKKGL